MYNQKWMEAYKQPHSTSIVGQESQDKAVRWQRASIVSGITIGKTREGTEKGRKRENIFTVPDCVDTKAMHCGYYRPGGNHWSRRTEMGESVWCLGSLSLTRAHADASHSWQSGKHAAHRVGIFLRLCPRVRSVKLQSQPLFQL